MPTPRPNQSAVRGTAPASAAKTVIVFGEILADVFPDRQVAGGAPFNVACHLRGFGADPRLATRIGCDATGEFLREAMQRNALDSSLVQVDEIRHSGVVTVIAEGTGHRFEIAPEQAFDYIDSEVLAASVAAIPAPRMIYFGTLAQRNAASREALATLLALRAAPSFVDLNLRPPWAPGTVVEETLRRGDYVKLSEDELFEVGTRLGWSPRMGLDDLGRHVAAHYRIERLVVTLGERGAWSLVDDRITTVRPQAQAITGGDTVGAGDAFSAVLIFGALLGWPLTLTMERAAAFAAAICGIAGATPSSPDFYAPFLEDWNSP